MQMHSAEILLLLSLSSAPVSLPCGLFIIYVSPLRHQKSPTLFCVVDTRGDRVLVRCGRLRVCLCVCKHVIYGD